MRYIHDLGNINYTYIVDGSVGDKMDMAAFCDPLIKTLKMLGIQAELTGRNDITLDGKKFSGNAQYSKNGRLCTMEPLCLTLILRSWDRP